MASTCVGVRQQPAQLVVRVGSPTPASPPMQGTPTGELAVRAHGRVGADAQRTVGAVDGGSRGSDRINVPARSRLPLRILRAAPRPVRQRWAKCASARARIGDRCGSDLTVIRRPGCARRTTGDAAAGRRQDGEALLRRAISKRRGVTGRSSRRPRVGPVPPHPARGCAAPDRVAEPTASAASVRATRGREPAS